MGAADPSRRLAEAYAAREASLRRQIEKSRRAYEARPSVRLARLFDECVFQLQYCIRKALGYLGGRR